MLEREHQCEVKLLSRHNKSQKTIAIYFFMCYNKKANNNNKCKRRKIMQILKYIMIAIYIVICLGLIILVMMQNKDSKGASGTITGSSTNNFYEKNKTRTREGKIKKWTIISGIVFLVYTILLGIIFMF